MVIKGGARSGPGELALHLLRADTNESVNVRELRHVMAGDLTSALFEMEAMGLASRSERRLYHANIDWRHDEHMTDAQKARAVDRLAAELGLSNQPRAVVEHVKHGREHLHVVWLRIDTETGKAISDSHNYRRHEIAARDLEREFGHERVQGAHVERDGCERPARTPQLHEIRQAERSGITPAEAKAELSRLWRSTDTGCAFMAAIEEAGWRLARGDKRDLVALDAAGEVHSLAKRIDGAKAKHVRERLLEIDHATLPSVEQARQAIRDRQREALDQEQAAALAPAEFELALPPAKTSPAADLELDANVAAILRGLDDQARDVIGLVPTPEPAREAKAQEPALGGIEGAAPSQEATQQPCYGVEIPEPVREPVEIRFEPSRLVEIVTAARDCLASLAGRLEQAFQAVRQRHQVHDNWQQQIPLRENPRADLRAEPQQHAPSAYDRLAALLGGKTPPVARPEQEKPALLQALEKAHREAGGRDLKHVLRPFYERSRDGYDGPDY